MMDTDDMPTRARVLYTGAKLTTGDRNKSYGEPVRNMQDIGDLWTAYINGRFAGKTVDPSQVQLTGEDVAHMCTLMKIARTYVGEPHPDNYVDGATYQAIAAECAEEEKDDEA